VVEIPVKLVAADAAFYENGIKAFTEKRGGYKHRAEAAAVIVGGPNKCSSMSPAWMKQQLGIEPEAYSANADSFKRLDVGFSYKNVDVGLSDLSNPQGHITEAGKVTPRGYVLDLPGARSVYDIMRDEEIRSAARNGALAPDLVRKTAGFRSRDALAWRQGDVIEKNAGGVTVRISPLVLPGMLRVPTVSFLPQNPKARPALLVTDIARANLVGTVRALVASGRPVMVAELRAFGETGTVRQRGFYGCQDADEEISMMCYLLGESLVGHRAEDLICAASSLSSQTGGGKVDLFCEGRAAIPGAHAFYAEPGLFASIKCERAPESWANVLADMQVRSYRFANAIHGALRLYDWTDLAKER
jgi:hypothetical protein